MIIFLYLLICKCLLTSQINKLSDEGWLVSFACSGCGGLGIFRFNGVSHKVSLANQNYSLFLGKWRLYWIDLSLYRIDFSLYRIDFRCVSKRLYVCIETTSICLETTCIETTLYRNDRKPYPTPLASVLLSKVPLLLLRSCNLLILVATRAKTK